MDKVTKDLTILEVENYLKYVILDREKWKEVYKKVQEKPLTAFEGEKYNFI